jgi:hypothetical protein
LLEIAPLADLLELRITLGNLLTISAVIIGASVTYGKIASTIKQHADWIEEHQECSRKHVEVLNELRTELAGIHGYLRGTKRYNAST